MKTQRLGPNVKALVLRKMSIDAIPDGGGIADGVAFLSDPKKIANGFRSAHEFVLASIAAVKTAPDNKWGDDDEAIAGEILRKMQEVLDDRKKVQHTAPGASSVHD